MIPRRVVKEFQTGPKTRLELLDHSLFLFPGYREK